jgi:hypothetical protein
MKNESKMTPEEAWAALDALNIKTHADYVEYQAQYARGLGTGPPDLKRILASRRRPDAVLPFLPFLIIAIIEQQLALLLLARATNKPSGCLLKLPLVSSYIIYIIY